MLGPSHLPRTHLSLGYVTALSLKYTQSYQPNSHKCVMLAVLPLMTVLGTSPLSSKTYLLYVILSPFLTLCNHPTASLGVSLDQLSLSTFLQLPYCTFCCICHGEYGSVFLTWQSACLPLCLNSPITCSLDSSITRVLGTPSCTNKSDNVSCTSLFLAIGYALHHVFLWA